MDGNDRGELEKLERCNEWPSPSHRMCIVKVHDEVHETVDEGETAHGKVVRERCLGLGLGCG